MSRSSRVRCALAFLGAGASLCAACNGPAPCWNPRAGQRLAIELVELYTPTSSYAYQSVTIPAAEPLIPVDSYPTCGPDFDFKVGETLHISIANVEGVDEDPQHCLASTFVTNSPMRTELTSFGDGGRGLLYVDGCSAETDAIQVDGCPSRGATQTRVRRSTLAFCALGQSADEDSKARQQAGRRCSGTLTGAALDSPCT
jgi:hypothetical protein